MAIVNRTGSVMWIPTPIYEALPYLYVLGGVLFISGTLYIGLSAPGASLYIACGLVSIVYGAYILSKRRAHRAPTQRAGHVESGPG